MICKFLAEKEIPAMIYYPVALRKQKAYFRKVMMQIL
jgi:hypothetical protein